MLEAMPLILDKCVCTLLVAGEIWGYESVYTRQITKLGLADHVRLEARYIPEDQLADYFAASDLVVLPYLSTTGSGVVKLAYSHHRPVVVSDISALSDVVREGETGYIVEPGNPAALAEAISIHFSSGKHAEKESAITRQLDLYSWDHLIEAMEDL